MNLQALVAYYDRLAAIDKIAPLGWTDRKIGWVVYLNPDGSVKAFTGTYETVTRADSKGKTHSEEVAKSFRVPAGEHKQGINPRLLWDNPEYALAIPKLEKDNKDKDKEEKKKEDARAKCAAFAKRIKDLNCEALVPIVRFLENDTKLTALEKSSPDQFHAFMQEVEKPKSSTLITFRLVGDDDVVCAREDVRDAYNKQWKNLAKGDAFCIVSGGQGAITETSDPVALRNGQSSGCRLVAFQTDSGFDSYNKDQGRNAPISVATTFKYSAALNALLCSEENSLSVGEETLLFWSSESNPVEDAFADLLGYHDHENDDSGAIALKGILTAAQKGQMPGFEDKERFWLLLLQPVSARIAVRLWVEQTPTQTAEHLRDWFADLDIVKPQEKQGKPISIYSLLLALAPTAKPKDGLKNLPPRLGGDLLYAAFRGTPLPDNVAQAVIRRLKSLKAKEFSFVYAALLKAWLIRNTSLQTERKPTVMLDLDSKNPGYRLGRLFAVLEKTQEESAAQKSDTDQKGGKKKKKEEEPALNATIKDKFYATASADPAAVFGTLLRMNTFHASKLDIGRKTFFERLKREICSHLTDIPAHLSLADQARFALGYYHQRQDFFTSKKEKADDTPTSIETSPDDTSVAGQE